MPNRALVFLVIVAILGIGGAIYAYRSWSEAEAAEFAVLAARDEGLAALASGDPGTALRVSAEALREHPDAYPLLALRTRAFCQRLRYSDALAEAQHARRVARHDDEKAEASFLEARVRAERFLESGDREEYNLAEAGLAEALDGGPYDGAARLLLGLAMAKRGGADAEARAYLEQGLADGTAKDHVDRIERARRVLESK
jgi:tetratricopeptide (TPR) repeat protein